MTQTLAPGSENHRVAVAAGLAGSKPEGLESDLSISVGRTGRHLSLYSSFASYDLQEELDFLSNRAIDPNVFFSGRFLAPAMPRLEDKPIKLAIVRDQTGGRSRLRMLMPYSIEKPGFSIGTPIMRAWSNPFGPLGTPLVDEEGAAETLDNFLDAVSRPEAGLPGVLVLPDVRLNGRFVQIAKAVAMGRNLPLNITNPYERPFLQSSLEPEVYFSQALSKRHLRDMKRQWRKLETLGTVTYEVSRQPEEIHHLIEQFLLLESAGWKGKRRTAMLIDRFQAAFAREAIANLAEIDAVRIHSIQLDGKPLAMMIVFIMAGEAYTWKTAYDENYAAYSPGKQLVRFLTEWHMDDANITRTDSCGVPDHPVMSRVWQERETMGTLVIGLQQNRDRDVRQVSTQLHLYKNTRNMARALRDKIMSLAGR
jgi:Acetyltransferase (GNAT) domain